MNYSNDWFMRQIINLANGLQQLLNKDEKTVIPQPTNSISNENILPEILKGMIQSGQINEAENLLFRCIENYPLVENYQIGLDFYTNLVELDDNELYKAGWSRDEILEGLNDLHQMIYNEPLTLKE